MDEVQIDKRMCLLKCVSSALIGWNKADHLLIGLHPSYYTNSEFHPQIIFYLLNQISYPNIGYFVFNSSTLPWIKEC